MVDRELVVSLSVVSHDGVVPTLASTAFVAVGVAMTVFGVARGRTPLLVGGMVGLWLFLPLLVFGLFNDGVGVPLAFLVGGGFSLALPCSLGSARHVASRLDLSLRMFLRTGMV